MEATMTTLLETPLKYRQGRKWKPRWCVIKKPSPVADKVFVLLYKNRRDRFKLSHPKLTFPIEGYYGVEAGFLCDKEGHSVAVICEKNVSLFAFHSREDMVQFELRIRASFGEEYQYPVRLCKVPPASNLPINEVARLHVQPHRLCVTAYMPPKILVSWGVRDLVRFGPTEGRFVLEASTACGKGEGVHVFLTPSGDEIMNILLRASPNRPLNNVTRRKSHASSEYDTHLTKTIDDFSNSEGYISNSRNKRHSIGVTDYHKTIKMFQKNLTRKHDREYAMYDIPPSLIRPFLSKLNQNDSKLRNDFSNSMKWLEYATFSKSTEQLFGVNKENLKIREMKNRQNHELKLASSVDSLIEEINQIYERKTACKYTKVDGEELEMQPLVCEEEGVDNDIKLVDDVSVSEEEGCSVLTPKMNKTLQNVLHQLEIKHNSTDGSHNNHDRYDADKCADSQASGEESCLDLGYLCSPHVVSKIEQIPNTSNLSKPLPFINFTPFDSGASPLDRAPTSVKLNPAPSNSTCAKKLNLDTDYCETYSLTTEPSSKHLDDDYHSFGASKPPPLPPKTYDDTRASVPIRNAPKPYLPPRLPPRKPRATRDVPYDDLQGVDSSRIARSRSQAMMSRTASDSYFMMRSNSTPLCLVPPIYEDNSMHYIDMTTLNKKSDSVCGAGDSKLDINREFASALSERSEEPSSCYIDMAVLRAEVAIERESVSVDKGCSQEHSFMTPDLQQGDGSIETTESSVKKSATVAPFPDILTFLEFKKCKQKLFHSDNSLDIDQNVNNSISASVKSSPKMGFLSRFKRWNSRDKKNKSNSEISIEDTSSSSIDASFDTAASLGYADCVNDVSCACLAHPDHAPHDRFKQRSSSLPNEKCYKQGLERADVISDNRVESESESRNACSNNDNAAEVKSVSVDLYDKQSSIFSKTDDEKWRDLCKSRIKQETIHDDHKTSKINKLSPSEQAAAIAKHVTSLTPFIPPKIKIYPKDLSPVMENATMFSAIPKTDNAKFYFSDSSECVDEVEKARKTSPATMKKNARAMLRIKAAVEDEEGNIWVQRHKTPEENAVEMMNAATNATKHDMLSDMREHMDSLSVSSHGTGSGSDSYSCRGDDIVLRSSPASTILRPRSGKEYRQIERRLVCDSHGSSPVTPQSPASVSSSVFTFDQRSALSAYSYRDDSSSTSTSTTKSPTVYRGYALPRAYVNLGKSRHESLSPYVNITPPNSPRGCVSLEQMEPMLNYVEIDMSQRAADGRRSVRRVMAPKSASVEYAKIDAIATEAVSRASKQHAQSREDSLRRNNYKTPTHKEVKRSLSARDRKTSTASGDSADT